MRRGLVLKKEADLFEVEVQGQKFSCIARKNMRREGVFVGDYVFLDDENTICKIDKRKNLLVRPPVANINKMFIVIAPTPKPDFYLVDKLILFCKLNNITPILCINKFDLDKKSCKNMQNFYKKILKTFIFCSFDESVQALKKEISGLCVLAGQSAVGKSSIINALKKEMVTKVDTFSKKIERGKQTTRTVQIYSFGDNKYLTDTAGFSKLDESLLKIKEQEIKTYYDDFLPYANKCKYKTCLHLNGDNCGVIEAVNEGKISQIRYKNYKKLVEIVKSLKKF